VVFSAAALLASCQHYEAKPLDPQVTAIRFGRRKLDAPEVRGALVASGVWKKDKAWPPSPWALRELQAAALYFHPEIAVARAKAETASAAITTADTRPNPTLSFVPEIGSNPGSGVSPWVLGFSLDVPLETAGKRRERVSQARAQANAAALSIADTAWTVCAGVRSALLDVEVAIRRMEILEVQRGNDDALVSMVAERVKAGEAPATDMAVYQSQQGRDSVDLADGRGKIDAARAKLADAIGVPAIALQGVVLRFEALDRLPAPPSAGSLRRAALVQRADILGALEDYAAADAALRLEIAKQYPDIHLGPGYTFDQGQSKWALGVGLTLPIDRNAGPIREARAKREEAAAIFERLQIRVRGELDQASAGYESDRKRLREIEALHASQNGQLENATRLTKAGEGERIAENNARSLVFQASLARIDALYQAQQSLGKIEESARISLDER